MVALASGLRRTGRLVSRLSELDGARAARHSLVTAAQCLLLSISPLKHPQSRLAVARFADLAASCAVSPASLDAVLLRVLAVLDPVTGSRLPSLVERYLAGRRLGAEPGSWFRSCVDDALRYRGVGDALVQRAIAAIDEGHARPDFTAATPASVLAAAQSELCVRFKRQTGVTIGQYLRDFRLDRAAVRLVTSQDSIKRVWPDVGYHHDSNFNHDFKRRFGISPGEYRARGILATPTLHGAADARTEVPTPPHAGRASLPARGPSADSRVVLIVDDDDGTREGVAAALRTEGFDVIVAGNGRDGLRRAAHDRPDIVLLDYWLGDMDGLAWLKTRGRQARQRDTRVVLWSADWDLAIAQEALALGAIYLEKCCDLDQLKEVLAGEPRGSERERGDLPPVLAATVLAVALRRSRAGSGR